MRKSNYIYGNIPNISTRKSAPMTTNFAKGIYTYKPNDTMDLDEIRLAQDARFDRVGEYGTRKGMKALNTSILGLAAIGSVTSATTSIYSITEPYGYTATAAARICGFRFSAEVVGEAAEAGIPKFSLYINGELADVTCINPGDIAELGEYDVLFNAAPDIENGDKVSITVTVQGGIQDEDNQVYISADDDTLDGALLTCTAGGINSIFEANIDGTKVILFVQNEKLYSMDSTGAVTTVRTLPTGTKKVRFSQNLNEIRYVDGLETIHKLTYSLGTWTDSAVAIEDLQTETTLNITPTNIMNGVADNLIYMAKDPDTEAFWTYPYGYVYAKSPAFATTDTIEGEVGDTLSIDSSTITPSGIAVGDWITGQGTGTAEVTSIAGTTVNLVIVDTTPTAISSYDKFSTDFYQNFPAIKTGDPLTAMFNLGGVLYFMTRRNKYQMYAQSADSWSQSQTNAQHGTFSQESVVCNLNYAYFANDNGIYVFDGSSEASLTENSIQNVYDAIPDKENIVMDLYNNRLYVFYTSTAGGQNDSCLVYNINLRVWESFDSNTYVTATSARQNASGRFLCGHSRIGLIMLNEPEDGDYSSLGQPIAFNLETSYQHFGTTSQYKRITKWRPQFAASSRPYTVECGYALDFTDEVKYAFSINLQQQTPAQLSYTWDNPSDYGVPAIPTIHTTTTKVNGKFYRCQIRYQHIAAFEPVIFRSHTLTVETQRIR